MITLTGFMGCGKTCTAQELNRLKGWDFIDLDKAVEKEEGRSIGQIFAEDGESGFRAIEATALARIISENGVKVLSLGGGTLTSPESSRLVHDRTTCIYLRASIETLVYNLTMWPEDRPMLKDLPDRETLVRRVEQLMAERERIYERTAHIIIDIDGKEYGEIAEEIARATEKSGQ